MDDLGSESGSGMDVSNPSISVCSTKLSRFSEAGYYGALLNVVLERQTDVKTCVLVAECGRKVVVPYFLVTLIMPEIFDIVANMPSWEFDISINITLTDVSFDILHCFKELVTTGKSDFVSNQVRTNILKFLPKLKLVHFESHSDDKEVSGDEFENLLDNETFDDQDQEPCIGIPVASEVSGRSNCSYFCRNNCNAVVQTWSGEDLRRLKGMFISEKITLTKSKLLNHLTVQKEVDGVATAYVVKGHEFCPKYFAFITGCSFYLVTRVLDDFLSGVRLYLHGNSGCMKNMSASTISAICWLKAFSEAYGQFSPEDNCTILSHWLTKQALYKMYLDEVPGPHIAQSSFYTMFKTSFGHNRKDKTLPWIRISKYSSHSVCSICVALNTNQRQCQSERELRLATDLRNNHRMNFGLARRKVEEIKQMAISFPRDHMFIQVDAMDNSKSYLPHYRELSKDQCQKERLPSKITGCTIYNGLYEKKRKVMFFINHDIFENGSNMIITIIYKLLEEYVSDHQSLPRKLHLNLDNCWKENKNRFLFSFLASLVHLNVFEEVSLDYLLVGHTGNEVDQLFSILCKMLKVDITTLEGLKERILAAPIIPKPICKSLDYIFDWKSFISDKLTTPPLKYQSKYNSFLLSVEHRHNQRLVVFRAKKLPQDTDMVPRAGIRLIKDNTEFEPVGCADYRVEKVNFEEIMKGLQVFLRKCSLQERIAVSESWDRLRQKLESLPGRKESFPKMKVKDLPTQSQEVLHVPEFLVDNDAEDTELTGDIYPEEILEGDLDAELSCGMDICVYTVEKSGRPWVGRVVELLGDQRFLIQWFTRKTCRSKKFEALLKDDGSRSISEMENGCVMFWQISENRTETSFTLSNFWLEEIAKEYRVLDRD